MARRETTSDLGSTPSIPERVSSLVESVLHEDLYWFPVRHHSPAVARHVESAILERKPKVIFLEAPNEANDLLPHLLDDRTQPPIAIYSSYRDDNNVLKLAGVCSAAEDIPPRFASWYPLLPYSPEYRTLLAAQKVGAEVVFMDLPHHALIPLAQSQPTEETSPDKETAPGSRLLEQEDERLLAESGFYQSLAKAAGYRSWPEAWDSLFEARDFPDHESFRRELSTFCAAARATTPPERIASDGTLPRERFMLRTIHETLKRWKIPATRAMVVCGGFHLFLDRADTEPPPQPPPGTLYVTVVPYSYFRVSELSGYAAGNRAPQFYQTAYDLTLAGRAHDVPVEHIVTVLKQARRDGEVFSSADAIAATQHAVMLARLRQRAAPVLDDLHDAIVTCCCKGDPREDGRRLLRALDQAGIGTRVGKVTPALGRLPIVNDFYSQISDLDLGAILQREQQILLKLDKRQTLDSRQSAFLHRLRFLGTALGELTEAPSESGRTGSLFRETWSVCWNPGTDDSLVELSLYGDSVETAAVARLRERLAQEGGHAGLTCQRLLEAVNMDLPDLVTRAKEVCGQAIDSDDRFNSQAEALLALTVLDRYAAHRQLRREEVGELIERCFDRACFALFGAIAVPEDQHAGVIAGLLSVAELVLRGGPRTLDRALFTEQVRLASEESPVPYLRGAFLGTLVELREVTPEDLAQAVEGLVRAPVEQMVTAGDFVAGILAVSRTSILLGADSLIGAIDDLLHAADWQAFLAMLPRLRAAFEGLHARQRDSLAQCVARLYGLAETETVTELRTSAQAAARIAEIDRQVARIMEQWSF
jgi:hypothetical protein